MSSFNLLLHIFVDVMSILHILVYASMRNNSMSCCPEDCLPHVSRLVQTVQPHLNSLQYSGARVISELHILGLNTSL